jgi:non-specific serine/threonine protein kinase
MAVNLRPAEDLDGDTSTFIGRKHEASAVRRLLSDARLLTLTGPGGVGKTRLALRSADRMRRSFRDGVALVELAKLEDADLLGATVAASVGLQDMGPGWITALTNFLAGKRMLLVLDNCEHVLESCDAGAGHEQAESGRVRGAGVAGSVAFRAGSGGGVAVDRPA